ncbi:MAG: DUF1015 domain-containing protein [Planctomycetota bacterium]|jgi:hypothetical protein
MTKTFDDIGLAVPTILLPKEGTNMKAWAVVACDQYTSQPEYWEEAAAEVGEKPSTLKLILPEVYLETEREASTITSVNETMKSYMDDGTLVPQNPGFLLVDRETSHAESRKGLMVALDLEHYDYREGSQTLMRATEGTIVDRLPPRIKVRQDAPVELPHIMVLIDDPDRTVIEPLFEAPKTPVYDTDLMKGGGHIQGWMVDGEAEIQQVADTLSALADRSAFESRYHVTDKGVLLYAMGDGNHSFATAKAIWEGLKAEAEDRDAIMDHPARYALVELVNIHDAGLEFEPIHRVVFGLDTNALLQAASDYYAGIDAAFTCKTPYETLESTLQAARDANATGAHAVPIVSDRGYALFLVESPRMNLVVATLQSFLDEYLAAHDGVTIDYIHGDEVVTELGSQPGNMGFYLPPIDKHSFFRTIIVDEALPRKTFSMGEADEKRYYLECRRIKA